MRGAQVWSRAPRPANTGVQGIDKEQGLGLRFFGVFDL